MAPHANGDTAVAAAEILEDIQPPPGMIIPPPGEMKEIIEKTAGYVVRGGPGIENRLRENHADNLKFSFVVNPDDAFNAYYEWRKEEYRNGRGTSIAAGRFGEAAAAAAAAAAAKSAQPARPKPKEYEFSARMPRINQKDLEVVRLAALFVAANGRQFMTNLAQKEAGNPQFQFLIPNHTFHNFFQHMITQYTIILKEAGAGGEGTRAQEARIAELQRNIDDKWHVLARARERVEDVKIREAERLHREEEEQKKREEFARIDWNDFVIVETIVFTESDNDANLPPPTTLNDIQYASLEEKNKVSISANLRIEEAFPFDDKTTYSASTTVHNTQNVPVHQAQPAPAPAPQAYEQYPAPAQFRDSPGAATPPPQPLSEAEQTQLRIRQAQAEAAGLGPVKIKENYVPRAAAKVANRNAGQMAVCPNCKQQIPVNELDEHMKIELLDPRWKEQKARADARYATTNLTTEDAAVNLKRLASQRSDIFDGVTGQPISEEEQARRKKAATSFDGVLDGKALSVDEQIRAIHQKFAEKTG